MLICLNAQKKYSGLPGFASMNKNVSALVESGQTLVVAVMPSGQGGEDEIDSSVLRSGFAIDIGDGSNGNLRNIINVVGDKRVAVCGVDIGLVAETAMAIKGMDCVDSVTVIKDAIAPKNTKGKTAVYKDMGGNGIEVMTAKQFIAAEHAKDQ